MNFSDYEVQLEKQIKDIKKDIARTKHELNTLSKDDINYEFKEYSLPVDIKMSSEIFGFAMVRKVSLTTKFMTCTTKQA